MQVVALCGDGHSACLAFFRRLPSLPVKARGPPQASAVTGMWSVPLEPQAGQGIVLVSFADASRALTAGASPPRYNK